MFIEQLFQNYIKPSKRVPFLCWAAVGFHPQLYAVNPFETDERLNHLVKLFLQAALMDASDELEALMSI
jgi:hypothetical protein